MSKKTYKFYRYIHPNTGEIFKVLRDVVDRDTPYILEDGVVCERKKDPSEKMRGGPNRYGGRSDREVFELDPDYAKKVKPKYVRYRDGHKEKYDPTKHC